MQTSTIPSPWGDATRAVEAFWHGHRCAAGGQVTAQANPTCAYRGRAVGWLSAGGIREKDWFLFGRIGVLKCFHTIDSRKPEESGNPTSMLGLVTKCHKGEGTTLGTNSRCLLLPLLFHPSRISQRFIDPRFAPVGLHEKTSSEKKVETWFSRKKHQETEVLLYIGIPREQGKPLRPCFNSASWSLQAMDHRSVTTSPHLSSKN